MNQYLQLKQQQYDEMAAMLTGYAQGTITPEAVQRNQQGVARFKELAGKVRDWLEKGQEQRSEDREIDSLLAGLQDRDAQQQNAARQLQSENKRLQGNAKEMQAAIRQHQSEVYELERRYTSLEGSTSSFLKRLPHVKTQLGDLRRGVQNLRAEVPSLSFQQLEGQCERLVQLSAQNSEKQALQEMRKQLQKLQTSHAGMVALLDQLQQDMQAAQNEAEQYKEDCNSVRQSLYWQRIDKAKLAEQAEHSEIACLALEGKLEEQKQVIASLEQRSASLETQICQMKAQFEENSRTLEKQTAESARLRAELVEHKAALLTAQQQKSAVAEQLRQANQRCVQQNFFVVQASDALAGLKKKYDSLLKVYWAMKRSQQAQERQGAEDERKSATLLRASSRCDADMPANSIIGQITDGALAQTNQSQLRLSAGECSLAESDFADLQKNLSDISAQLDRLDSSYGRPLSATLDGTHSLRRESGLQARQSVKDKPEPTGVQRTETQAASARPLEAQLEALPQRELQLQTLLQRNQVLQEQTVKYARLNAQLNKQVESLKQRLGAQ